VKYWRGECDEYEKEEGGSYRRPGVIARNSDAVRGNQKTQLGSCLGLQRQVGWRCCCREQIHLRSDESLCCKNRNRIGVRLIGKLFAGQKWEEYA